MMLLALLCISRHALASMPELYANTRAEHEVFPVKAWNSYLQHWTLTTTNVRVSSVYTYASLSQRKWYGVAKGGSTQFVCQGGENGNTRLCSLYATHLPTGHTRALNTNPFWQEAFAWSEASQRLLAVASAPPGDSNPVFTLFSIDPSSGAATNVTSLTFGTAYDAGVTSCGLDDKMGMLHLLVTTDQSGPMIYVVVDVGTGRVVSRTSMHNIGFNDLFFSPSSSSFVGVVTKTAGGDDPWNWVRLTPNASAPSIVSKNIQWVPVYGPELSYYDPEADTLYSYSTYNSGGNFDIVSGLTGSKTSSVSVPLLPHDSFAVSLFA